MEPSERPGIVLLLGQTWKNNSFQVTLSFSLGFGQHWTQHFLFLYCFDCTGCFKPQNRSRNCCRGKWTVKTQADLCTLWLALLSPSLHPAHSSLAFPSLMMFLLSQWRSWFLQRCGSQSIVPRTAASVSLRNLLEMPFPGPPRATESEIHSSTPSRWFRRMLKFENYCFSCFQQRPACLLVTWLLRALSFGGQGGLNEEEGSLTPSGSQVTFFLFFEVECFWGWGGLSCSMLYISVFFCFYNEQVALLLCGGRFERFLKNIKPATLPGVTQWIHQCCRIIKIVLLLTRSYLEVPRSKAAGQWMGVRGWDTEHQALWFDSGLTPETLFCLSGILVYILLSYFTSGHEVL